MKVIYVVQILHKIYQTNFSKIYQLITEKLKIAPIFQGYEIKKNPKKEDCVKKMAICKKLC